MWACQAGSAYRPRPHRLQLLERAPRDDAAPVRQFARSSTCSTSKHTDGADHVRVRHVFDLWTLQFTEHSSIITPGTALQQWSSSCSAMSCWGSTGHIPPRSVTGDVPLSSGCLLYTSPSP